MKKKTDENVKSHNTEMGLLHWLHVFIATLKVRKLFGVKIKDSGTEEGKICHFGWQLRKWLSILYLVHISISFVTITVFGFLACLVDRKSLFRLLKDGSRSVSWDSMWPVSSKGHEQYSRLN